MRVCVFRLLFFLLVMIVMLMASTIALLWRRSSVRVTLHGLELAAKNETDISLLDLAVVAAQLSFTHESMLEMRSGSF